MSGDSNDSKAGAQACYKDNEQCNIVAELDTSQPTVVPDCSSTCASRKEND